MTAHHSPASTGNALDMYEAMRSIIEAPGYPFLTHYKDDFYKLDRAYILSTYTPNMPYFWVVRETGTDLVMAGLSQHHHDTIDAAIHCCGGNCEMYFIQNGKLRRMTKETMREALKKYSYALQDSVIYADSKAIGSVHDIQFHREDGATVLLRSAPEHRLTREQMQACISLAETEVRRQSQSLFARTRSIYLDGQDLRELVSQAVEQANRATMHQPGSLFA